MIAEIATNPAVMIILVITASVAMMTSYAFQGKVISARSSTSDSDDVVARVLRNSAIPIASQLCIRIVDLGVAIFLLRLLGPEGNGRYAVAVVIWLYVKTVSDFGLSLLVTRDIARDRSLTGHLVGATTLLRLAILGLAALPVAVYAGTGLARSSLAVESAIAIGVLYLSIVPSSYSEAANSALNGFERMEVAAWINICVSVIRAPLVIVLAGTQLGVQAPFM